MIQVDMHVHSRYSRHPSEWFLQRIGAQESYTEVEEVYRRAKARGMTYVTLTDHNTIDGALELHARHPYDTFVSAEVTSYFPEDGCKVHVLVYGITPTQFEEIQALREDIYRLRNYLRHQQIACSLAHATYSVNDRLTIPTLEKLLLLFDVFEGINGGRDATHNRTWTEIVQSLTPELMIRLQRKHDIEPWSENCWIKVSTGGSDDHSGLFVGKTFTIAGDATISGFLDQVRQRQTRPAGRHSDHKSLACAVYKIAHEFSRAKRTSETSAPWSIVNSLLFEDSPLSLKNWLFMQRVKRGKQSGERVIAQCVEDLMEGRKHDTMDSDAQIARMYNALAGLSDGFFSLIAESFEKDLKEGRPASLVSNFSAAIPALFLLTPFITVLRHMHGDREFLRSLATAFHIQPHNPQTLLWFSDTITDLNGVAVTMRELATRAHESNRAMKLVTCLAEHENRDHLPPNVIFLPCIYHVTPGFYNAWTLRLPSLLRALDMIAEESPSQIVISTPGPVGLIGALAARLLRIKCVGVYHTDFTRQADVFINDPWVSSIVESYTRGFFTLMDEVRIPTERYMTILAKRGISPSKMKLFRRGIEPGFAVQDPAQQAVWRTHLSLPAEAPVLLWAGRMGKEKNLDFLFQIYDAVFRKNPLTHMLLIGDGPELDVLRLQHQANANIHFLGRVNREELPHLYTLADMLVFPSTTDTFGMVVLEAQACGLPAIVSDVGGPQELVTHKTTGFVAAANDLQAWVSAIENILDLKHNQPDALTRMRTAAQEKAQNGYGWDHLLTEMMKEPSKHPKHTHRRISPSPRQREPVPV